MRVNRALEKLRTVFAAQGITVTSVLLATVLATGTTTAVPAGLSAAIMATTLAGTAAAATAAPHAILMSMFSAKTIIAAVGAALLAGTVTYLVQQRRIEGLKTDNLNLVAQHQQSAAERETASQATQAAQEELARSQKDNAELLRLRNEVGRLRRERDAAQQRANQAAMPSANSRQSPVSPGRYISKDQLAFAGYATPEASLESQAWALINGNFDHYIASWSPDLQKNELNDPRARERFEHDRNEKGTALKGMQVVARKTLAEDRVELKVRLDIDSALAGGPGPGFIIQQVVRVGNDWKLGPNRMYDETWDQDGQAQQPAQ